MSEWWNLDQALIWIVTRDLEQVELAEGDADGIQERAHCYFGLTELGSEEEDGPDEMDDTQGGLSSFKFLLRLLRDGKVSAVRADDETSTQLPSSIFNGFEIGPHDGRPTLTFRRPTPLIEASMGRARGSIPVLLWRSDILKWAPERAGDDLLQDVEALAQSRRKHDQEQIPAAPKKRTRGKSQVRLRVEQLLQEYCPDGLPSSEAPYGAQSKIVQKIQRQLSKENTKTEIKSLTDMVRRAGGLKPG